MTLNSICIKLKAVCVINRTLLLCLFAYTNPSALFSVRFLERLNQRHHRKRFLFGRNRLAAFAARFAPVRVKFRCGIESFSPGQRARWNKGVPASVTATDVAHHFDGVCLLCCTADDSRERIIADIETARRHFEYFSVNVFCNNNTAVKRNDELAQWFAKEVYPVIKDYPGVEVLLNNTDLGVG